MYDAFVAELNRTQGYGLLIIIRNLSHVRVSMFIYGTGASIALSLLSEAGQYWMVRSDHLAKLEMIW